MTGVLMRGEDTEEMYAEMAAEIVTSLGPHGCRELEETRRVPEHFSNNQGINCSLA